MKSFIVDTSALYAFIYKGDKNHHRIQQFIQQNATQSRFVVSNYIFDETMTLLKSHFNPIIAIQAGKVIRNSDLFTYLFLTQTDESKTWEIFVQYNDKEWSYTDCSCLALMQRLRIKDILAFDHHFTQMGVNLLPGTS